MIKKIASILWVPVVLLSCAEATTQITLGEVSYNIPSNYVVSYEEKNGTSEFDDASNMVALTFSEMEELGHLAGQNGWLPRSPISVMIYDKDIGSFENILSNSISTSDKDIVEFKDIYRLFKKQNNSRWSTIPKSGEGFETSLANVGNVPECTAMGGMDGIKSSRTQLNIPTSCKVTIIEGNLVFRFTSTEKNLVENFQLISQVVLSKLESWKVSD